MSSKITVLTENVQEYLERSDWKSAIKEMERLFAINQDPLIRVRIGDVWLKLDRRRNAIRDYVRAADLFAEKGFVVKALAQYTLALRLDPSNDDARSKIVEMQLLRTFNPITKKQNGPREYFVPQPCEDILPQCV